MKKEYDFSKAERGRFYRPNAKLNLPVYLEPKVQAWLDKVAGKRGEDVGKLVNRLLKKEIELAEAAIAGIFAMVCATVTIMNALTKRDVRLVERLAANELQMAVMRRDVDAHESRLNARELVDRTLAKAAVGQ